MLTLVPSVILNLLTGTASGGRYKIVTVSRGTFFNGSDNDIVSIILFALQLLEVAIAGGCDIKIHPKEVKAVQYRTCGDPHPAFLLVCLLSTEQKRKLRQGRLNDCYLSHPYKGLIDQRN